MTNQNFNFGYTGDLTNFTFIEISEGTPVYDFNFGSGIKVYKLLPGLSNNFNSIWADANASINSGLFYIGRQNDLIILNNNNHTITDYYSKTEQGEAKETLKAEDSTDINVA